MKPGKRDKKANISDQKENASSVCYSNSPELRPEYRDDGSTNPEPSHNRLSKVKGQIRKINRISLSKAAAFNSLNQGKSHYLVKQ
jgi:hypothetical protein